MIVFSKARLVMLSVPKTGSTAYQAALAPLASMVVRDPPELKHAPVFRYNRFFRPMLDRFVGGDIDVVAVMREPVDWLGSWYRYRGRAALEGQCSSTAGISFDDFVRAYMQGQKPAFANVGSQAKFMEPSRNGTAVTHLFRYEDQAGLQAFLEARLGVPVKTDTRNASPKKALSLSAGVEEKLRRKCREDFDLWNGIGENGAYTPPLPRPRPR